MVSRDEVKEDASDRRVMNEDDEARVDKIIDHTDVRREVLIRAADLMAQEIADLEPGLYSVAESCEMWVDCIDQALARPERVVHMMERQDKAEDEDMPDPVMPTDNDEATGTSQAEAISDQAPDPTPPQEGSESDPSRSRAPTRSRSPRGTDWGWGGEDGETEELISETDSDWQRNLEECIPHMHGEQDRSSDSDSEPYHYLTDHNDAWAAVKECLERTGTCPRALIARLETLADQNDQRQVDEFLRQRTAQREEEARQKGKKSKGKGPAPTELSGSTLTKEKDPRMGMSALEGLREDPTEVSTLPTLHWQNSPTLLEGKARATHWQDPTEEKAQDLEPPLCRQQACRYVMWSQACANQRLATSTGLCQHSTWRCLTDSSDQTRISGQYQHSI